MPYRQWVIDGKKSDIRRVSWQEVALLHLGDAVFSDIRSSLVGERGKWTAYNVKLSSGTLILSGSKECLEMPE